MPARAPAGERGGRDASPAPTSLSRADRPRHSRWFALAAITVVSFLLLLEDTAVSVALPSIRAELGVGLAGLEWIVNAYTLALAVLVLPAGKLADGYGRRRVFVAGLVVFTTASLVAGLAASGALLIAARGVQGAGAALTASAGLSIISVSFPAGERGRALGVWAGASSVGLALGPIAGAMLTEVLGWAWVFLINVPLGLAAIVGAWLFIPESSRGSRDRTVPWLQVALWAGALFSLLMALTAAGSSGWSAPRVLALAALSAALLAVLCVVEGRAARRLLDRALLMRRQTVGANVVSLLSTAIMCNLFFFIPLYLQLVGSYGTAAAGAALLPLTATIVAVAPLAGWLSDRIGRRLPIVGGLAVLAAGLLMLSWVGPRPEIGLIVAGLALSGIGIGFTTSPVTAAALDGASSPEAGESAGLLNTSRMIGLSLGIATMGAIVADSADVLAGSPAGKAAFAAGLSDALLANAVVGLIAAGIAVATIKAATARRPSPDRPFAFTTPSQPATRLASMKRNEGPR